MKSKFITSFALCALVLATACSEDETVTPETPTLSATSWANVNAGEDSTTFAFTSDIAVSMIVNDLTGVVDPDTTSGTYTYDGTDVAIELVTLLEDTTNYTGSIADDILSLYKGEELDAVDYTKL